MINFILSAFKIIILLGTLVFIHELGHFAAAKLFRIKVNEFAIGFGPVILKKQGKQTKYALRLIPLGGFVSMEGEEERSANEGSFSEAGIIKRIIVISAGGIVNIIFAIIIYFLLVWRFNDIGIAFIAIKDFVVSIFTSLKMMILGGLSAQQMMGPVGISNVVSKTNGIVDFLYILSLISLSLGVTNLMPFPPLDGGKIVLLIIEAIRKKPLNEKIELYLQMGGFSLLILLSLYITYNDVIRII
ncbi:MAG TPA: site-2 protease family protein [Clostridia bacterium]|nr:site-2 protease family protein [Clostridia bacterium]